MPPETKNCQNCKQSFTIEPEDFLFYERVKVPPPTFCSDCRMVRRMMWRNERALYKREDDFGQKIISVFSADKPYKVYEQNHWRSDNWDAMAYGRDYDFSEPFFNQFLKLLQRAPQPNLANIDIANSDYVNYASGLKNCYLVFGTDESEDVAYAARTVNCKTSYDLFVANKDELCYQNVNCHESYGLFLSINSSNSLTSAFLNNCHNCENCFGCVNLRNKKYHIFNKPYTPDEYQKEIAKFDLGSYQTIEALKEKFRTFALNFPRRFVMSLHAKNSTGDNLHKVNNCHYCFDVEGDAENVKFLAYGVPNVKDSYDLYGVGFKAELCYEVLACGASTQRARFGLVNWSSDDIQYCVHCYSSSHLFGCIGLKKKQYCILNKQYSKEEYETLVPEIIQHMNDMPYQDKKGRTYKHGKFFPSELSPFCYNETIAQEYFPLTKQQAIEQGCSWKDPEPRNYQLSITNYELPDNIKDVKDDIVGKVIECGHQGQCNEQCTEAFRIIEPELQFYRRMNLPLPRLCPNCRHYQRLKQRNPLKLWTRHCSCTGKTSATGTYTNTCEHDHGQGPCPNTFETSYSPDRPEIVYCEQCYLKEVV